MADEKLVAESPVGAPVSGSGMDPKLANALNWVFAPLSSVIFIFIEKEDKTVKMQAWQSLIYSVFMLIVVYTLLPVVTFGVAAICLVFVAPIDIVLRLILAYKVYQGEEVVLPVIGKFSQDQANK